MTRRRGEPHAADLLRFIADEESLQTTLDEFPKLTDERLRQILRETAADLHDGGRARRPAAQRAPAARPSTTPAGASRGAVDLVLNTDGASRGNPGPAAAGWVIRTRGGELLASHGRFLGRRTNNEAEYEAVIAALREAVERGARDVLLRTDSELLARQISGRYRVKNERLKLLHGAARELIQRFRRFEVRHVPREQNAEADAEANRAIDAQHG